MMEATVEDTALDAKVAAVDDLRVTGRSVAAACRVVGISTSTYYRRRRGATAGPGKALAQAASAPARDWPFATTTPRAPMFWDQAFQDELTDSFVRREFGGGGPKARPGRALEALASSRSGLGAVDVRLRRLVERLSAGPMGAAGPALLAVAAAAAVSVAAGWMVALAANPAAWLGQAQDIATLIP